MEMCERIAGSNAGVKTKTVPNNTEKCYSKISLPKIIIYDVDNNIVKPVEDLDTNAHKRLHYGQQVSKIGKHCIKRDKLPSGSNAFQQLLQEMFDEEDKNTSVVDPDPKYVGSVRTDKDVSKHIASGRKPTPSYSILETSRTGQNTDGTLSHKEGSKSFPESLRPQISSLTCTRGLDAFWNEINGMDDVFGESEEFSAGRGISSLSRA